MINYNVLTESLTTAGYDENSKIAKAVKELSYVLDAPELSETERSIVLQLFSSKGLEQLQDLRSKVPASHKWSEFEIGVTTIGDIVRVRLDAYTTANGQLHNGLVGTIESVFGGRVSVRYVGRYREESQTHPRELLEILKAV